jgi:hypothetical protein
MWAHPCHSKNCSCQCSKIMLLCWQQHVLPCEQRCSNKQPATALLTPVTDKSHIHNCC